MTSLLRRVFILGAAGVGKTAAINQHKKVPFSPEYKPTRGYNTYGTCVCTRTRTIYLELYDCAGQEEFGRSGSFFEALDKADAVVFMFDITSRVSYKAAQREYLELKREGHILPTTPMIICGTKTDLSIQRKVSHTSQGHPCWTGIPYVEISAKNGNCDVLWLELARLVDKDPSLELPLPAEP
jgi:small GTP-binding protein